MVLLVANKSYSNDTNCHNFLRQLDKGYLCFETATLGAIIALASELYIVHIDLNSKRIYTKVMPSFEFYTFYQKRNNIHLGDVLTSFTLGTSRGCM